VSGEPTLLYLEADDEITTVVRRLRAAAGDAVVLVAPGRSRATSSAVALRLLARAGEEQGLQLSVVGDGLTRSLAAEAGLTAYATVEDARAANPVPADAAAPAHAAIHVIRGPVAEETAPVRVPRTAAETETRPVAVVPPPSRPQRPSGPRARTPQPAPRVARRRTAPLVAVLAVFAALLLLTAFAAATVLPAATIRIVPRTEPVGPVPYRLTVEEPERVEGTISDTAIVSATGTYAVQTAATGAVVFFNWNFVPVEVPAETLVADGEQAFATTETIVVPAGDLTSDGRIRAGEGSVAVVASAIGPGANVEAAAINEVLSQQTAQRLRGFPRNPERLVINPEATAGGADSTGIEFTQADVDAAVAALREQLEAARNEILAETDGGLVADPVEPAEPTITGVEGLAGTRDQEQAEISGELAYDRLVADESEVRLQATERFVADQSVLPDGHQLLAEESRVSIGPVTREGETLLVEVEVSGRSMSMFTVGDVVERAIGLTPDEARAALADLGEVTVDLWPGWVATVPDSEWRISVEVEGVEEPVPVPSGS